MEIKIIDYGYENEPFRAHSNDAGADVYSMEDAYILKNETRSISLGFGLELPYGYAAFVYPRSGLSSQGVSCELPPIDSSYTGEIHAIVVNNSNDTVRVRKGDRIGQLLIMPIIIPTLVKDVKLRGNNGFGSTGV